MRMVGMFAVVGSVALAPQIAFAGRGGHDEPVVRDHRGSDHSEPVVRDHRGDDDHHSAPVVRDHRGEERVREHRDGGGDIYYSSDDVYLDDSGSSGYFQNPRAPSWTLEVGGLARRFRGPSFTRT